MSVRGAQCSARRIMSSSARAGQVSSLYLCLNFPSPLSCPQRNHFYLIFLATLSPHTHTNTIAAPPYCGKVANTTEKYWQHNCNPLTYPMADLPVKLMCSLTPAFNNDSRSDEFQCYFSQEEAMMGALGMKCKTGSCLYNTQPPPPPSPSDDPSDDRPQNFAIKYPQIVTLITLATIFGSGVITALVLIKRDLRSSHRKFDRIASLVAQDQLAHSYIEATPSMRERRGLDFEAIREGLSEANGAQGRDEGEQEEEEEEREGNSTSSCLILSLSFSLVLIIHLLPSLYRRIYLAKKPSNPPPCSFLPCHQPHVLPPAHRRRGRGRRHPVTTT